MSEITFNEENENGVTSPRTREKNEGSAVANFLIKTGIVKTEEQAIAFVGIVALLLFVGAAFYFIRSTSPIVRQESPARYDGELR